MCTVWQSVWKHFPLYKARHFVAAILRIGWLFNNLASIMTAPRAPPCHLQMDTNNIRSNSQTLFLFSPPKKPGHIPCHMAHAAGSVTRQSPGLPEEAQYLPIAISTGRVCNFFQRTRFYWFTASPENGLPIFANNQPGGIDMRGFNSRAKVGVFYRVLERERQWANIGAPESICLSGIFANLLWDWRVTDPRLGPCRYMYNK